MGGIFISYAREDGDTAQKLEEIFRAKGIQVWRDQESIYAGEHWPKAIGQGIAGQKIFLLLWSKNSSASHFVEFEWNTALALQKTIVPVFIDKTRLPAALSAKNGVSLKDVDAAVDRILVLLDTSPHPDCRQNRRVLDSLKRVEDRPVESVLETVKTIYRLHGWQVHGNVYQVSGRDIHITVPEPGDAGTKPKKWWEKWQARVTFLVALLTLLTFVFEIPKKAKDFYQHIFGEQQATCTLKGVVVDTKGMPVGGAKVTLEELPGQAVSTTSDGSFKFERVPGKVGDSTRVYVSRSGYKGRNEYVTLPGPVRIILEEQ